MMRIPPTIVGNEFESDHFPSGSADVTGGLARISPFELESVLIEHPAVAEARSYLLLTSYGRQYRRHRARSS
jgi:hypothetical protein